MASKKHDLEHIEIFHEKGLYLPGRLISLDTNYDESEGYDTTGVDHTMANRFLKNFTVLAQTPDPITIIMNTPGGNEAQGLAIYDLISSVDNKVTVLVSGEACSMGSIILQAADVRKAYYNAVIMIHGGEIGIGASNPEEMKRAAAFQYMYGQKRCDDILFEAMIKKDPKLTIKKFRQLILESRYYTASEALGVGLLDEVCDRYEPLWMSGNPVKTRKT